MSTARSTCAARAAPSSPTSRPVGRAKVAPPSRNNSSSSPSKKRPSRRATTPAADAVRKNSARKIREMKLALIVEETMTKDQILEGYLNLAYYGDQAYGIEAAALHYFGKHASQLDLSQAATLAGVVQMPGTTDPRNHPDVAERRRNVVLDRMAQLGIVTSAEAEAAKVPTVESMLRIRQNAGGTCARSSQPFFCNYVIDYLKKLPALGANEDERMLAVNRGGLKIKTTLRSDWQETIFRELT